jgi:hypothetical protein
MIISREGDTAGADRICSVLITNLYRAAKVTEAIYKDFKKILIQ